MELLQKKILLSSTAFVLLLAQSSQASASLSFTEAQLYGCNNTGTYSIACADMEEHRGGESLSVSNTHVSTGIDHDGDIETVSSTYTATASTTSSELKAAVSIDIESTFSGFDGPADYRIFDNNDPFLIDWNNGNPVTNPSGLASEIGASSSARLIDNLVVVGASNISSIAFEIDVHGDFGFGGTTDATAAILQNSRYLWSEDPYRYGAFEVEETLMSNVINLNSGSAYLDLILEVDSGSFANMYFNDGMPMSSFADFSNTITIGQFYGYDAAGLQVDLQSVTSSNGHMYETVRVQTASVPEPSSILLFGSSLLGFLFVRRRKQ